jgi:hypothetical protein
VGLLPKEFRDLYGDQIYEFVQDRLGHRVDHDPAILIKTHESVTLGLLVGKSKLLGFRWVKDLIYRLK